MTHPLEQRYGSADFTLGGFQLWVHGYQFPDPTPYAEDNDWLIVSASYAAPEGYVWSERDPGLYVQDLSRWVAEVKLLRLGRMPQAVLCAYDALFAITAASNGAGDYTCQVELDPGMAASKVAGSADHPTETPWEFAVTACDLRASADQVAAILARYPSRLLQPRRRR